MNEIRQSLDALLARCCDYRDRACLTLTAIHPDGQRSTPSRHVPLNRPDQLKEALVQLLEANRLGWGAFVAVGLRRRGLTRYRRGSEHDVLALPAVFVDVDDPSAEALAQVCGIHPAPSCITFTGGGYHAYWWLDEPLSDMRLARGILRSLQQVAKSDTLSPVQSLRLVGSRNTKPDRDNALCRIVEINHSYHSVQDFEPLLSRLPAKPSTLSSHCRTLQCTSNTINPAVLHAVSDQLRYMGYVAQGDWLCGPCLYPAHHQHGDAHHSFGFNVGSGYGNCFRCGSFLLKDICTSLGIDAAAYGGVYTL